MNAPQLSLDLPGPDSTDTLPFQEQLQRLKDSTGWSSSELARRLGSSFYMVSRWVRGDAQPTKADQERLRDLLNAIRGGNNSLESVEQFASGGIRRELRERATSHTHEIRFLEHDTPVTLLDRLAPAGFWGSDKEELGTTLLKDHQHAVETTPAPAVESVSAGKNTYTYDAHTYHTKVPPQGIAEVIRRYLPQGRGLVLDPFGGSGMTGVAALVAGHDVILNELSPAASFIADRFTSSMPAERFIAAVGAICSKLAPLRRKLYFTTCRECQKDVEILHTIWSYRVACTHCSHRFVLWDHCRSYGKNVREHKILSEFPCPACTQTLKKSKLPRLDAVPVMVAYKCCQGSIVEHPLTQKEHDDIHEFETRRFVAEGWYPTTELPDGANLSQPKRRGLTSIDKFYSGRNLSAMSHIWQQINRVAETEDAAFLAFCFTSLYQRVTQLSEFRFWGGSGNTAHFNVPYIFKESNVFLTFERKAKSIADHLATTATQYNGRKLIRTGSATDLSFVPANSIDFIFTDPPFGANINYSDMNFLWESWLGRRTNVEKEAIVSKPQKKGVKEYQELMTDSLSECYRVLRDGHWMVLVFMISSEAVWEAIRNAVLDAGFEISRVDIFDKQHGTFKHFVSENTAGCDLMLHCRKVPRTSDESVAVAAELRCSIESFLDTIGTQIPRQAFLHVSRSAEIDYRLLYSQYIAETMVNAGAMPDFVRFKEAAKKYLEEKYGSDGQSIH